MTTTGIITVPVDDVGLANLVRTLDRPRCRFERTAGSPDATASSLWIQGADETAIDDALAADPSICAHDLLFDAGEEQLYEIDFADAMVAFRERLFDHDGTILEAYTGDGAWTFHLRFPTRSAFSAAVTDCEDAGDDVTVHRLFDAEGQRTGRATLAITDGQYEALCLAVENGYFEVPREVTLQELAGMYGCTHQALSELLRRATGSLAATITAANATPTDRGLTGTD